MGLIPDSMLSFLLDDLYSGESPDSAVRLLYVDGVQVKTPKGNGLNSEPINSTTALKEFGIDNVKTGWLFFYPNTDRSLLDQSVPWQISYNGGIDQLPCNVLGIRQDRQGYGWEILVDEARREFAPNLTITWQFGLGTFVTDSATGNPIEDTEESTSYAVMQQRNASRNVASPGNDPARFYLEGYFCDDDGQPIKTPEGFQWQRRWPTTWTDDQTGLQHSGLFEATLRVETPLKDRPVDIGSQLQGWFISQGTGAVEVA